MMEISFYALAGLALVLVYLYFDRLKKAKRIMQLEAAIRGSRTGQNIPYESLALLNSLREKAALWNGNGDNPAQLTVTPAQIAALDSYLSHLFSLVPELRAGHTSGRLREQKESNESHTPAPLTRTQRGLLNVLDGSTVVIMFAALILLVHRAAYGATHSLMIAPLIVLTGTMIIFRGAAIVERQRRASK